MIKKNKNIVLVYGYMVDISTTAQYIFIVSEFIHYITHRHSGKCKRICTDCYQY
jgi:hypothetical protein